MKVTNTALPLTANGLKHLLYVAKLLTKHIQGRKGHNIQILKNQIFTIEKCMTTLVTVYLHVAH